jgi:hypothetical protein
MESSSEIDRKLQEKDYIAKKLKESGKDSAQNSEEEDEVMRDARDNKEEKEHAESGLINYNFLGSEECPVNPEMEEIEYSMIYRIPRIEGLGQCTQLRVTFLHF